MSTRITSVYLRGIDNAKMIGNVHYRPAPPAPQARRDTRLGCAAPHAASTARRRLSAGGRRCGARDCFPIGDRVDAVAGGPCSLPRSRPMARLGAIAFNLAPARTARLLRRRSASPRPAGVSRRPDGQQAAADVTAEDWIPPGIYDAPDDEQHSAQTAPSPTSWGDQRSGPRSSLRTGGTLGRRSCRSCSAGMQKYSACKPSLFQRGLRARTVKARRMPSSCRPTESLLFTSATA